MEYKVDIKTNADLAGAKATAQALDKVAASASKANAEKAKSAGILSSAAKNAAAAAAAYISLDAAIRLSKAAVGEYISKESELLKLNTALAASGNFTKEYADRLVKMADALQDATAIEDDRWLGVLNTLTKFGADASNIDKAVEAVKRLSGALGVDIESAAMLVSKALQGNYTMLSRYGIKVSETATQAEKFAEMMEKIRAGAGQMEAQAGSLGGQFSKLGNSLKDLGEGVVALFRKPGGWDAALYGFTETFKWLKSWLPDVKVKTDGLKNSNDKLKSSFDDTGDSAKVYKDKLKALKDEASRLQDALSDVNGEIEQQLAHEEKMAGIGREQQMASLDLEKAQRARGHVWGRDRRGRPVMVRAGAMSDAEYEIRKGRIEQGYLAGQAEREMAAQGAQISNIQASYNYARRLGDVDAMQKYGQQLASARTGLGYRAQEYGAQFGAEGTKMAAGMSGLNQSFGMFAQPVMAAIADLNRKYAMAAEEMRRLASQVKNNR